MKVPFRQTNPFGCGHFALANLFNDERYLTHIEDETGSFVIDLNKSLQEFAIEKFWLSTAFRVNHLMVFQNRFIDISLFDLEIDDANKELLIETAFRPFLAVIKIIGLLHFVSVIHCLKNDLFYVVDSLKSDVDVVTKEEFVLKYYVTEIFIFESQVIKDSCKRFEENKTLLFDYNFFTHLKP